MVTAYFITKKDVLVKHAKTKAKKFGIITMLTKPTRLTRLTGFY